MLCGGDHADSIDGGDGDDTLEGSDGNDYLVGKQGNDILRSGKGVDLLKGYAGDDLLDGGDGNDVLNGGSGDFDQLLAGDGKDVLLDWDGVVSAQGGSGNDLFALALRNGWRDPDNQARFTGLTAGYGNDIVGLVILDHTPFHLEISGDEYDEPPSPLEGNNDRLALLAKLDPTSSIIKFERVVPVGVAQVSPDEEGLEIDPTTLTDESGAEFLSEPVGSDETDQQQRMFLPLVTEEE
jgi:hypothetical protein